MANYFVLDSKFTPYTFEELIKPYQLYNEAYKEQEAALDAAAENEFASANIGEGDTLAKSLYDAATGKLSSLSEELATKGLTAGIRARVKSTARDYKNTMKTLETAQKNLNAERERRLRLGPKYIFKQDTIGLDNFLNGNTVDTTSVNLDDVKNEVAVKALAKAKEISNTTWEKVINDSGKYTGYYDIVTKGGLTTAQIDIITDDKAYNEIMSSTNYSKDEKAALADLRKIVDDKRTSLGYNEYQSYNRGLIDNAISTGMQAGILEEKHQYKEDQDYISDHDRFVHRGSGFRSGGGSGSDSGVKFINNFKDPSGKNKYVIKKDGLYHVVGDEDVERNDKNEIVGIKNYGPSYTQAGLAKATGGVTEESTNKGSVKLYRRGHSLSKGSSSDFNKSSYSIRDFSQLNSDQKESVKKELKEAGYDVNDPKIDDEIVVLYDRDSFRKSDYMIISRNHPDAQRLIEKAKNASTFGKKIEVEKAPNATNNTTVSNTSAYTGDTVNTRKPTNVGL